MKYSFYILALLLFTFASCGKKDDPAAPGTNTGTGNNPAPNPASPYYFNFTLDGKAYKLNANFPQYMLADENVAGGYQASAQNHFPSMGLSFRFDHNPSDMEVKALAGRKLYFDDTDIRPQLTFSESDLESKQTAGHDYYVQVDKVTYLKHDPDAWFGAGDIYVISGTCNAILEDYSANESVLSDGKFNMVISRRVLP